MLIGKHLFLLSRTVKLNNILNRVNSSAYKIALEMKTAYFRCLPSDPSKIEINFHYQNPKLCIDRDFNFSRNSSEIVDVFLDRIKNNIEKELSKKMKKKKVKKNSKQEDVVVNTVQEEADLPVISVLMCRGEEPVSNISFQELLKDAPVHTDLILKILEDDFQISYNQPWVVNIALPTSILAGFILYPCRLEILFAERDASWGVWYRGMMPNSKNIKEIKWIKIHEGLTYTTTNSDIDYHIKFELTPRNSIATGPSAECISKTEVQAGPGPCPFEVRHQFTSKKLNDNQFRVISYNLLADLYADSDFSRNELFPYCPPYALHIDYRKQLFIKEILGYNGDIVCLQEVDGKVFNTDLIPVLEIDGFLGVFIQKGKSGEGLATFYRKDRFEFIADYSLVIGENLSKLETFKSLWEKIKNNEKLIERITNLATTLQVSLIRCKSTNDLLLVANTHLYFHPDADHIRLLQIGFSMMYIESIYNEIKQNLTEQTLSLLFCGDFNSVPECGIYKLMTEKHVNDKFIDWQSNEEQAVKNVSLQQSFDIKSACGCPQYTNYTVEFKGCLDYIFYQTDNLEVTQVIPLPSHEEITAHIAIPSVIVPSDHIALVADLQFK